MKRLTLFFVGLILLGCVIVLVGLIPINNSFEPTEDGIEIFVVSNAVHADLVLPIQSDQFDWRSKFPGDCFAYDPVDATHIAIGWGDAGFFVETPTWNEFKLSTAAQALLWASPTCMHVHMTRSRNYLNAKSVRISRKQYMQLVEYILSSFQLDESGNMVRLDASYGEADAFFKANGHYHLFNTCNSWVGRGLQTADVRTGLMTPLPGTPAWYLPE